MAAGPAPASDRDEQHRFPSPSRKLCRQADSSSRQRNARTSLSNSMTNPGQRRGICQEWRQIGERVSPVRACKTPAGVLYGARQSHQDPKAASMSETPDANPGHRAHRLSRRRQDDAAQPHPVGEPRQALRRHRQRVRRDRHRQRPDRRIRRRNLRDEQWLRLLHGARRPDPRRRGPDAPAGPLRRASSSRPPALPIRCRWRRPSSWTTTCAPRPSSTPSSRWSTPSTCRCG